MAKSKGFDPATLGKSEVVLLNGTQLAVALAYTPGETPQVVAKAVGREATALLWCAQELGLALVECGELTKEQVRALVSNSEIPAWLFRPAAQSIALAQRNQPAAYRVRLMRDSTRAGTGLAARLGKTVEEVFDDLEVAKLHISVGKRVALEPLAQLLELHRHRLQVDTGIPLSPFRLDATLEGEGLPYEIKMIGVVERKGQLEAPDQFGELLKELYGAIQQLGWRLLGYREVEALLGGVAKRDKGLYTALFPARLNVSMVRQILRSLLKEHIPISNLTHILEILLDSSTIVQDPDQLTEYVRAGFSRQICQQFSDDRGILHALLVEPSVEFHLMQQLRESSAALWLELDLDSSIRLLRSASKGIEKAHHAGVPPVVLCSPRPRRFLRRLLEPTFPHLPVLSFSEIAPLTEVRTLGTISL